MPFLFLDLPTVVKLRWLPLNEIVNTICKAATPIDVCATISRVETSMLHPPILILSKN